MQVLTQRYGVTFPPPQIETDAAAAAAAAAAPAAASGAAAFGKKLSPSIDRAPPTDRAAATAGGGGTGVLVRSGCAGLYCGGVALENRALVLRSVLPPGSLPPQPCHALVLQNGFYEDLHRQKEVYGFSFRFFFFG